MQSYIIALEHEQILCREGDTSSELYLVDKGSLLVCVVNGTQVKALAKIHAGEFIGELSFFDNRPRSTYIIALEKCTLIHLPQHELLTKFPQWFIQIGRALTKKIRLHDTLIHESQIRHNNSDDLKLSMEEQRYYYDLIFPKSH